MRDLGVIFLLCLSTLINLANCDDSDFIDPRKATDEIVESLHKITTAHALPVILFEIKEILARDTVAGIRLAEVKDGRLASGTKFYSKLSDEQIFFCPKSQAETSDSEQCLAPKKFEESQILQCDFEPIPTIRDVKRICASSESNIYLRFSYKICSAEEPDEYKNDPYYTTYFMCYNKPSKKMLFVAYFLDGTALLGEKLLIREREIIFEMNTETYGHIDADYYANLSAEIEQKPEYKLQKLVLTEDMPLVTSRKTTHYFGNFALLHGALFDVWNKIINYFRDHAILRGHNWFARFTGLFDIPKNEMTFPVDKNQKMNIWVTTMVDYSEYPAFRSLAVLMNNFIVNYPKNQDDDTGSSEEQFIDKLCDGENYCADSLKKEFNALGVQGRCCKVTKEISALFINDEDFTQNEILHVENITSTD